MRQVQTLYCDDIRQEVGGKLTYVGAYAGSLLVSSFPAVLPKFCVAVSVVLQSLEPGSELILRILKDDTVLAERGFDAAALGDAAQALQGDAESLVGDRVHILNSFFVFSPFEISGPCALRVRAHLGGEELRGVGLRIDHMSVAE